MNSELINRHYKPFRLTVALCAAGILTISGLSCYIENQTLHKNAEHALEDAVFAIQEIVIDDDAAVRVLSGATNAPAYLFYKEKLTRFLSQSRKISFAGMIMQTSSGDTGFLAAGPNAPDHKIGEHIRAALLSLPEAEEQKNLGDPDGNTYTVTHHLHLPDAGSFHAATSLTRTEAGDVLVYYAGQELDSLRSQQFAILSIEGIKGIFCIIAVFLSVFIYSAGTKETLYELNIRNRQLEEDLQLMKNTEKKLREVIRDNERFNSLTLGREERIIQLKSEVNQLLSQMQREKRYNVNKMD